MDGYIYLIQCGNTTYYKIGITHGDIYKRLQTLQTGCPYKLKLVMMFLTPDAETLEAETHEMLNENKVNGEWFDLCDPQVFANVIFKVMPLLVNYADTGFQSNDGRVCTPY